MQRGVNLWDAAGFLGMTVQQLEQGYGHHHPDYQQDAVAALGGQHGARNTVNKERQTARERHENRRHFKGRDSKTPRSGRGGRRFKSCHSDQKLTKSFQIFVGWHRQLCSGRVVVERPATSSGGELNQTRGPD